MLTLINFLLMLISILTVVLAANTADYQMKRDCKKNCSLYCFCYYNYFYYRFFNYNHILKKRS